MKRELSGNPRVWSPTLLFIVIILLLCEFFTAALVDGFSLEFEWQQVSSGIQDSSQYSGRSLWYCILDGLPSCSYFQVLHSLFPVQSLADCTECTNHKCYHRHFHDPLFFQFFRKVKVSISLFAFFFSFTQWLGGTKKFTIRQFPFSCCCCCCWLSLSLVVWSRLGDSFLSQNPWEVIGFKVTDNNNL